MPVLVPAQTQGIYSGQYEKGGGNTSVEWKKKRNEPDGKSNEDEEQKGKFPKDLPMTLLHLLKERRTKKRVSMDSRHLNE